MGLFKTLMRTFYFVLLFMIIVFVGEIVFPGTVFDKTFSPLGIFIIIVAVGLDGYFNFSSLD